MSFRMTSEEAKRLILQAPDSTRRTAALLTLAMGCVALGVLISIIGMSNSWTCELDSTDPAYQTLCRQIRAFMGCNKVSGPLRAQILLNVKGQVKASAQLVCSWDNALSELKICIFLSAALAFFLGFKALSQESRKQAEFYIQLSYFFTFLLALSSVFDFFAISAAQSNNQDVCTLTGQFEVDQGIEGERLDCSYWWFSLTAYFGIVCAVVTLASSLQMKYWKSSLTTERF